MKSIKVTDYFKIIRPVYKILRLIPDTSIRNYDSSNIARAVNHIQKSIFKRIHRDAKIWHIETTAKCSFMIDIKKDDTRFYFLVPDQYEDLFREKINEIWPRVTIEAIQKLDEFSKDSLKYQIYYKFEDPLSLAIDKRNNEPLNSVLSVLDIMQEGDRVAVFYNFMAANQRNWVKQYDATMRRYKANEPLNKEVFSKGYAIRLALWVLAQILDGIIEGFTEAFKKKKQAQPVLEAAITDLISGNRNILNNETIRKKDSIIIKTQIAVLSSSNDKNRKLNNANAVAQAFYQLNCDNELKYTELHQQQFNFYGTDIGTIKNKTSVDECKNFLEIPGYELLNKYNCIQKVDVKETMVPKELNAGKICIGENIFKGTPQKAYLSIDKNLENLALCIVGPTRSGKSTLLSNIAGDAINAGECVIIPDFILNCELSSDIAKVIPQNKVLILDCSNPDTIQGLGYNEIKGADKDFEVWRNCKMQTSQILTLIDSINADSMPLTAKMRRYLGAAAKVVFISPGQRIKDVIDVLQDHVIRMKYVKSIQETQRINLEDSIRALEELNDYDKEGNLIGTKGANKTDGIIDRIELLKENTYLEIMLNSPTTNNINLAEEMQKNQLIVLKMPESMFQTQGEKNILTTYWITKIWLALQIRPFIYNDIRKVNIIVDELYQVPNAQRLIRDKLSQCAKFLGKFIISCHYLNQINIIRDELKAANSSYMLLQGCDKDNFRELKDELSPYEVEDLLNMKRYHSLNLIKYEKGYAKFITKLPPPIKGV